MEIETAIKVNKIYDNTWYLRCKFGEMRKRLNKILDISVYLCNGWHLIYLKNVFKLLVDSDTLEAMHNLNSIYEWQSFCNHQYGTDNYT